MLCPLHSAFRTPQSAIRILLTPHPLPNKALDEPPTKLSTMAPRIRIPHSALRIPPTPYFLTPYFLTLR
jgi:hypothetical protein